VGGPVGRLDSAAAVYCDAGIPITGIEGNRTTLGTLKAKSPVITYGIQVHQIGRDIRVG